MATKKTAKKPAKKAPAKKKAAKPAAKAKAKKPLKKAAPSPKQNLKKVRAWLESELERLKARVGTLKDDDSLIDASNVGDITDAATQVEAGLLTKEIQTTELEYMNNVIAALKRIEDGTYGSCSSCGGKIEPLRLEALPHVPNCIACKRKEEKGK